MVSDRSARSAATGRGASFWRAPHRPLFLAATLCALVAVGWWPLGAALGLAPPPVENLVSWHAHELLFGFGGAAVGGYVLTALSGWSGAAPVQGATLKVLTLLWLAARLAILRVEDHPALVLLTGGYGIALAAIVLHQLVAARRFDKLGFAAALIALSLADAVFVLAMAEGRAMGLDRSIGQVAVIGFALLIVSVAGRAIPAFTRNWILRRGGPDVVSRDAPRRRWIAQGLLVLAMGAQAIGPEAIAGLALVGAAGLLVWIALGWQPWLALRNPLLAALHLGFLWVPAGLLMLGVALLHPGAYPAADARHALTLGAMAGLIMAIAGRAGARRINGDLMAGRGFVLAVALNGLATLCRLAVPLAGAGAGGAAWLLAAGALWCGGWIAFLWALWPTLSGPVIRPILSGKRHEDAPDP